LSHLSSANLPVVLLYNLDPSWTAQETEDVTRLSAEFGDALSALGHCVTLAPLYDADVAAAVSACDPGGCIVFNWCESLPGVARSEALVAAALEQLGFTFTGGDSGVLALAQDKCRVRAVLQQAGIRVPRGCLYREPVCANWATFPAIVKAANEHCSEGLTSESVVMNRAELEARVRYVLERYRQPALVEEFIDGREFHVSVWGNGTLEVLPIVEMDFSRFHDVHDRLCSYEAKFVPGSKHYEQIETLLPAPLTAAQQQSVEQVCRRAHRAVGCRDYGRVDLRVRDGACYVLDVNPNADISSDASLACAAEAAGYSYGQVGSRIVTMAAARHLDSRVVQAAP
jgi:D-alanine-D-alanine ligase